MMNKEYEIEFHDIVEGSRPTVTINNEMFKYGVTNKKGNDTFIVVQKIKNRIEAILSINHEYNLCIFRIESRDSGYSKEIISDLSYSKEMKKTAEKVIRKELEEFIQFLRDEQKYL